MFIKYEAEVSSRVGGVERGVVDFGKLFTETNEQKFSLGGLNCSVPYCLQSFDTVGWASGRASGLYRLNDEVLVWLSV